MNPLNAQIKKQADADAKKGKGAGAGGKVAGAAGVGLLAGAARYGIARSILAWARLPRRRGGGLLGDGRGAAGRDPADRHQRPADPGCAGERLQRTASMNRVAQLFAAKSC